MKMIFLSLGISIFSNQSFAMDSKDCVGPMKSEKSSYSCVIQNSKYKALNKDLNQLTVFVDLPVCKSQIADMDMQAGNPTVKISGKLEAIGAFDLSSVTAETDEGSWAKGSYMNAEFKKDKVRLSLALSQGANDDGNFQTLTIQKGKSKKELNLDCDTQMFYGNAF